MAVHDISKEDLVFDPACIADNSDDDGKCKNEWCKSTKYSAEDPTAIETTPPKIAKSYVVIHR